MTNSDRRGKKITAQPGESLCYKACSSPKNGLQYAPHTAYLNSGNKMEVFRILLHPNLVDNNRKETELIFFMFVEA